MVYTASKRICQTGTSSTVLSVILHH